MQPFLYTSLYQSLEKRVGGVIMEINTIGLRLFTSCGALKQTTDDKKKLLVL